MAKQDDRARKERSGRAGEQPQERGQRADRDRAMEVERELEEVGTER